MTFRDPTILLHHHYHDHLRHHRTNQQRNPTFNADNNEQAMILANTFFKTEPSSVVAGSGTRNQEGAGGATGARSGSTGSRGGTGGGTGREERVYLLRDLRDHDLWKHPRWEPTQFQS